MGIEDASGNLVGGIIFHDWQPERGTIEMSCAAVSPKWASRGVLRAAAEYVFGTAGCQATYVRTDEGNTRIRRLCKALGAQEYIIPRLRGRNASEAVLIITDDAAKAARLLNGE